MTNLTKLADAESRLLAWLRDYGATKQKPFTDDLTLVLAELARLREVEKRLPKTADGVSLTLGRKVYAVRQLANSGRQSGYGSHGLVGDDDVVELVVASVGYIGNEHRRASYLQGGMSFTISADSRGIFSTRAAALSALASPAPAK